MIRIVVKIGRNKAQGRFLSFINGPLAAKRGTIDDGLSLSGVLACTCYSMPPLLPKIRLG